MSERTARILNESGLHARPATRLVALANRFEASIEILVGDESVDAKSVMEVLTLAASKGTDLRFRAVGPDEIEALDALEELVNSRFGFEET